MLLLVASIHLNSDFIQRRSGCYEVFCLLGYNTVKVNRRFGEHITSTFKVEKQAKRYGSMKQTLLSNCFILVSFLLYKPEDGGDTFL
jgi:hypothetical protein